MWTFIRRTSENLHTKYCLVQSTSNKAKHTSVPII